MERTRQAASDNHAKVSPDRSGTVKKVWIQFDGKTRVWDIERYENAEQMEERCRERGTRHDMRVMSIGRCVD